ncbi:glucosamine-6-phosphate deaminase [Bacillus xiamenensis]|uniref:Glucosamine-6-phosphate deaminase n=1 Tax=Bacillus xiamenensis TaxID=1178537 RepID=A0AAC9IGF2_9BACI|nr:glucosamine-6-phosphate deaminase [Bacillus xiamenensis]AOZ89190.1 glucosamine-6-phosphate deaminase [Bacillus xiamenensis]EKF35440.1 glucosamine-6-phosphate deaminase [Bacillus xiamenensis]MBG9912066.1 glucosamine-6-phosphate deaminase [Bacillus xiamenensis]MCW1835141.1 glucosamine-6-phosphate deaminase [Bacillus xiamenensis]MCY9577122.1 glucosamine-6-phosphate deaminase [Bacillus xiamenensis]
MNIIEFADKDQLGKEAAAFIARTIKSKADAVLGLATGGTPIDTYKELIRLHQAEKLSFKQTRTVNLDEYVGLDPNHENSYMTYMRRHLFDHIDLPKDQYFLPNGAASQLEEECLRYDQLIEDLGGIDLQLLGIGQNGHIGFNEPGTPFDSKTHVVQLDEHTRKANARYFSSIDEVPTHAITMGIASILSSKKILLLASGKSKAEVIQYLEQTDVHPDFPASALKLHQDVTIFIDREAGSLR